MAHYSLIDGSEVIDEHDIAEQLYIEIDKKDYIAVRGFETDKGISLDFVDKRDRYVSVPDNPGLYLIYRKGAFNQYECLYSGSGNIRYRIYRFMKELADKSREDETHSAAKKARRLNLVSSNEELYIKYIPQYERDSIVVDMLCKHLKLHNIDEHLAHIAKAKLNKKVKKA